MTSFIMRAKAINGDYVTFTLADAPLYLTPTECCLANKEDSPLFLGNTIQLGDKDTNLFVGDIVKLYDVLYLVAYERGFYGINENHVRCHLDKLQQGKVVGNIDSMDFAVTLQRRKHLRFKYNGTIFTLRDIIGVMDNNLLVSVLKGAIDPELCQQDVGIYHEGSRLYLGDTIGDSTVTLHNGRICMKTDTYIDLDRKEAQYGSN